MELGAGFAERIPTADLAGLRPRAWLCVGAGFAREDVKGWLLEAGHAFVGEAVTGVQDLCLRVIAAARGTPVEHVLGSTARQEGLRMLLAERRISARMPELKRLRRQSSFFRKLDRSLQAGRTAFAHEEEESVYSERLDSRFGKNPVREEIQFLARAYEAWLEAGDCWDLPRLLQEATQALSGPLSSGFRLPEEIVVFAAQEPESRERAFWDALGRHAVLRWVGLPSGEVARSAPAAPVWERWHTLDDAAERLADQLIEAGPEALREAAILLPDLPGVRRVLIRALGARGIPLADPRDPTRLRWDEGVKWALLPLEAVSGGFDRQSVVAWLRAHQNQVELGAWVREIHARGIRQGMGSYEGGKLSGVHSRLRELEGFFGGRRTARDIADAHLRLLRAELGTSGSSHDWTVPFFETLWAEMIEDLERVGTTRAAPLLFWVERLQARLDEATPPVEKLKPREGVAIFRLNQAPLRAFGQVWLFGLPPHWLAGDGTGDYWFSEREREVLAAEFAVRSSIQVRQERVAVLRAWVGGAEEVGVLDAQYDWDGRERETVLPVLRELGFFAEYAAESDPRPSEPGAHPRWIASYGALRPVPPLSLRLPSLSTLGIAEIRATELDRYSRCGFQGLAGGRWRLWDTREPSTSPWPEVRGNILHRAVQLLLESRDAEGNCLRSVESALDQAWIDVRPQGLLRGARLEKHARRRLIGPLEKFVEQERDYVARAGTRILHLEGPPLRLELDSGLAVVGVPDRVDEHPDGLFVLDNKSSGAGLPKGLEMTEQGYRLQLPFYAVAIAEMLKRPVIGLQFVELGRKGGRGAGLFFKQWNGKEPGRLTATRNGVKSLVDLEPAAAWIRARAQIEAHAQGYAEGRFEAKPKKEEECKSCGFSDVCGWRRTQPSVEEEAAS